uniref:Uncharacterized protein n=1 Tax=Candidatus Phytoplasma tritici TaxID=321961 RepID=K7W4U5_9MOLU|nr:hypothetical protein [Candidatus Phytoplasma tritici]
MWALQNKNDPTYMSSDKHIHRVINNFNIYFISKLNNNIFCQMNTLILYQKTIN